MCSVVAGRRCKSCSQELRKQDEEGVCLCSYIDTHERTHRLHRRRSPFKFTMGDTSSTLNPLSIAGRPQESLAMLSSQSMLLLLHFLVVHCSLTMARMSTTKIYGGEIENPLSHGPSQGEPTLFQNKNSISKDMRPVMMVERPYKREYKMDQTYDKPYANKHQTKRLHFRRSNFQTNQQEFKTSPGLSPAVVWKNRRLNQRRNQTQELRYGKQTNASTSKCQCRIHGSDLKRLRNIFNIHDNDCCFSNRILDRAQNFLPGIRRLWNNFPSLTAQIQGNMDLIAASSENADARSMENLNEYNTMEKTPHYNSAPFGLQLLRPINSVNLQETSQTNVNQSSSSPLALVSLSGSSEKPRTITKRSTFFKKLFFKIFDFDFDFDLDEKDKKEHDKGYLPVYPVLSLQYQPVPQAYPVSPMMNYMNPHHPPEKPKQHYHYHVYQDQQPQHKMPQYTQTSYSSEVRPVYQPPSSDFYDRKDSTIFEHGLINNYPGPSVILHTASPKVSTIESSQPHPHLTSPVSHPHLTSPVSYPHLTSPVSHPQIISSVPHQMTFSPHLAMTSTGPQMMYRIGRSSDTFSTKVNDTNGSGVKSVELQHFVTPRPTNFHHVSHLKPDHETKVKPDGTKVSVEVFVTREFEPNAAPQHHSRQKNSIRNEELNPINIEMKAERKMDEQFQKVRPNFHHGSYPGNDQVIDLPLSRFLIKPKENESQQDYLLRSQLLSMNNHQRDKIYHYATPDPRTFSSAVENSGQYLGFPKYVFPKRHEYLIRKLVNQSPRHGALRSLSHSSIGSHPQHSASMHDSSVIRVQNEDPGGFQQVRPSSLLQYPERRSQLNPVLKDSQTTPPATAILPFNTPINQNNMEEQRSESHAIRSGLNVINNPFVPNDHSTEQKFNTERNSDDFKQIVRDEGLNVQPPKQNTITRLTPLVPYSNFHSQGGTLNNDEETDDDVNPRKHLLLNYSGQNQKQNHLV